MQNLILTRVQADSIARAMSELDNVGGRLAAVIDYNTTHEVQVLEQTDGSIRVMRDFGLTVEVHASQTAFVFAYGLIPD